MPQREVLHTLCGIWACKIVSNHTHTHIFIDLAFRLVQEATQLGLTQTLDKRQTKEDFVKDRLIFFLSLLPLHPTLAYIQHSLSSSLICLTGWQRLGLNSRECQKKHPALYLDGLGEGTENNYGILFGWIEGKSGNFPFWPFDKNKLKSFLSLHPHYYGIHLFY